MKSKLAATFTMTLLLAIGSAASQDAKDTADAAKGAAKDAAKDAANDAQDSAKDAADDAKDAAKDAASDGAAATASTQASAEIDGEPPELKKLAGSYTLVGNQADSIDKIKAAVDAATADMGALKKKVARKRLDNVNKAVTRLKISSVQKTVTVGMDHYVVTAPLDGGTAEVLTPAGDKARASFSLEKAALIQDIVAEHGRRENIFRFDSHGQLLMHVRETSPALTAPVRYTLTYKRAGQ